MFSVESMIDTVAAGRRLDTYRHSRQPNVPQALAYARHLWGQVSRSRPSSMRVVIRNDAGRIVTSWHWRRV